MDGERVGLVLAGGGARGAYEAGALSVLLPTLQARGQRPNVYVGSSVGAINAAYLAATAHLDAEESVEGLVALWRQTRLSHVVRPLLTQQMPLLATRLAAGLAGLRGVGLAGLLDPSPIGRHLARWNDWAALRRNIDAGRVRALAVLATAVTTERTVVFCDGTGGVPTHRSHALTYVPTRVGVEHIQASAAIPLLFPPVQVTEPAEAEGWYLDGGVRLNTPIKPALDLNVDRLVVIATTAITNHPDPTAHSASVFPARRGRAGGAGAEDPPELGDVMLNVLHGKLVDPLIEDLRTLGNINTFFAGDAAGPQHYRHARGKAPYRHIPYIAIAPHHTATLADLATVTYREHFQGLRQLRSPDLAVLARLLGANSPSHNELFSYLFFAPEFVEALIVAGAQDAKVWLDSPPGARRPWQHGPLDAFTERH